MLLNFYKSILSMSLIAASVIAILSCEVIDDNLDRHVNPETRENVRLDQVAQILSEIPLSAEHLEEVYSAVSASSENGYDEEYTMADLFESPGRGVGDSDEETKAGTDVYTNPLRELIENHVRSSALTKSSGEAFTDPDAFLEALTASDIQIYWPFSESWDGSAMPVVTFDPEDGSDANIGYRLVVNDDGSRNVEQVVVDEALAQTVPVWVINRNSDAGYTTLELIRREDPDWGNGGGTIIVKPHSRSEPAWPGQEGIQQSLSEQTRSSQSGLKSLVLKDFTMQRHYDTWFAGASEFFVKIGAVDDFTAATEAELLMYNPLITDFMIVVKRNQLGKTQKSDILLVSDWNPQMTHCAFMITEDDGGTKTEWKCTALVRIKSMSYGVELSLPFSTRDDIVWRGQLAQRWLEANSGYSGSFGDVDLTFEVVEY